MKTEKIDLTKESAKIKEEVEYVDPSAEEIEDFYEDPSAEEEVECEDPSAEEEDDYYDDTLEIIMPIDYNVLFAA